MTAGIRPWSETPDPESFSAHRPDWMSRAACYGLNDDTFFPEGRGAVLDAAIADAQAICARCPVLAECDQHRRAKPERYGIWGGTYLDTRTRGGRRICDQCHQLFKPNSSTQIYCDRGCFNSSRRQQQADWKARKKVRT